VLLGMGLVGPVAEGVAYDGGIGAIDEAGGIEPWVGGMTLWPLAMALQISPGLSVWGTSQVSPLAAKADLQMPLDMSKAAVWRWVSGWT
jgi:hypothetical protein